MDLWSAGVVLFAMLYGTVPFKAASMDELHSLILRGAYLLKDDISQEARDMLRGLLEINPHKRLTYDQIYNHPWLADYDDSLDLFNDQEREMIKKEYTYNDPSRFNRNENEDPIDCFTEHNIDSVYNTLKNVSEKFHQRHRNLYCANITAISMEMRDAATITSAIYVGTPTTRLMLSAPTSMPATKILAAITASGCSPASIATTMPL